MDNSVNLLRHFGLANLNWARVLQSWEEIFLKFPGPWWLSGLERYSFVLVMLKVQGSYPSLSHVLFWAWKKSDKNLQIFAKTSILG